MCCDLIIKTSDPSVVLRKKKGDKQKDTLPERGAGVAEACKRRDPDQSPDRLPNITECRPFSTTLTSKNEIFLRKAYFSMYLYV